MSPTDSQAQMKKTASMGRTNGPYTESLKVRTQMNDATGAESMPARLKYPQAAAMMEPTRRPMTTLVDFMMGDPKRSHKIMVTKTEKPRPRYSGDPQGSACGAVMSGHFAKNSSGFASAQSPDPPAQFLNPDWIRLIPINMTAGPVTMGGKSLSIIFGGRKERAISNRAQTAAVPIIAPYPSGQGNGLPSSADGQYPLAYICLMAPEATGMMENEMPTTEISPVPIKYLHVPAVVSQKAPPHTDASRLRAHLGTYGVL